MRRYDTETGSSRVREAGDLSVGEPVFAPEPGRDSEEHGHRLTFATDRTDGASWFLVIPAEDPAAGPVARARIPLRVPLGLARLLAAGCRLPAAGCRLPAEREPGGRPRPVTFLW
ncbi:carotenoid oxygenase family protein [Streptomyces virginiae]|uniref:carotenoid oxygenase family protein n=1 Tax=Streptomyces virginiae TaxID=1961 RepID=UPI0036E5B504